MKLTDAINDYLKYVRYEKGLAKTTCKQYTSWLHHYTDWLLANGYPDPAVQEVFTLPVLRRYQYAKARTGIRPRTMHSAFHALRGLGRFLMENGLLTENPCDGLTLPKKDAAQRLTVTDAHVSALFDACERLPKPRQIVLTRAVLAVLCYGGLRRAELCDLQIEDVDLVDRSLLIRMGKGSKSRKVFVCQAAVDALREWLAVREKDTGHSYIYFKKR